ncbi:unnamed protein product [Pleuronectes platessa]|uniref:Uncharacterized protein n=1 Tax=Pleuronectes platessa TaxID=8262 RepID=A0A9N7UGV1_PLEPL|nr:unnamed protein product [Pleuronectes platessa]
MAAPAKLHTELFLPVWSREEKEIEVKKTDEEKKKERKSIRAEGGGKKSGEGRGLGGGGGPLGSQSETFSSTPPPPLPELRGSGNRCGRAARFVPARIPSHSFTTNTTGRAGIPDSFGAAASHTRLLLEFARARRQAPEAT